MTHQEFINKYLKHINWHLEDGTLFISEDLDFSRPIFEDLLHIKELPDNLHISGWLDIQGTKITKLPENLHIGNMLFIRHSYVNELPDSIIFSRLHLWDYIQETTVKGSEKLQLRLISQDSRFIRYFIKPTKKAKTLHNLLWNL